jgi:hypothetical protein
MCFITHFSMFQFIALLFYNIVIIHVADLLIMFCFCNKYFLNMYISLHNKLFNLPARGTCANGIFTSPPGIYKSPISRQFCPRFRSTTEINSVYFLSTLYIFFVYSVYFLSTLYIFFVYSVYFLSTLYIFLSTLYTFCLLCMFFLSTL